MNPLYVTTAKDIIKLNAKNPKETMMVEKELAMSVCTLWVGLDKEEMNTAKPRPKHAVNNGEPKTEDMPIRGEPAFATAVSATKSPIELAHDSTVMPRISVPCWVFVSPVIVPKLCSKATTSFPIKSNHAMVAMNARKTKNM